VEYVIVRYPILRDVIIDGRRAGRTNEPLRTPTGRHTFHLGDPVDYRPAQRTVDVTGTAAEDPMIITFTPADLGTG